MLLAFHISTVLEAHVNTGTLIETGGIPHKFVRGKRGEVEVPGIKKDVFEFDGKKFLFEKAIRGDLAILRAWKADKAGNCVFR